MPRGSQPGERRGGRQKGTPNKSTALKKAALCAASADTATTPLEFLLSIMRDPAAPTGLRVQVARAAAPLVHGKPKIASVQDRAGYASAAAGFNIDIAEAKAFRDMEHRRAVLMRKRFGPIENGALTAAEIVEEAELGALINKKAAEFVCPPGYGSDDVMKDSNRLHQLNCKRMSPPAYGGGELKGAEDEEEAFLTARVAAFWHSPEGRDRKRMRELEFKGFGRRCLTLDEQKELDQLTSRYPEPPRESELATAIAEWRKKRDP
jgi:hypothetical protein